MTNITHCLLKLKKSVKSNCACYNYTFIKIKLFGKLHMNKLLTNVQSRVIAVSIVIKINTIQADRLSGE